MAFAFRSVVSGEFRGARGGLSKAGKPYRTLVVEQQDGRTAEFSASGDLVPAVDTLHKGDLVSFPVLAVSSRERSYVMLTGAPEVAPC